MSPARLGVRGSRTGRPVMVLLDLLGRRTVLRILWELWIGAPISFRALEAAAETNPSVLNNRLKELRRAHLVDQTAAGYVLTTQGRTLMQLLLPLNAWADNWAKKAKAVAGGL